MPELAKAVENGKMIICDDGLWRTKGRNKMIKTLSAALVLCIPSFGTAQAGEYQVHEVLAIDGQVQCFSYREGWITTTTGPCSDFKAPERIFLGASFSEGGNSHIIKVILATQADEDWPALNMKKGDWACAAAESADDLGNSKSSRNWLSIPKCAPIQ